MALTCFSFLLSLQPSIPRFTPARKFQALVPQHQDPGFEKEPKRPFPATWPPAQSAPSRLDAGPCTSLAVLRKGGVYFSDLFSGFPKPSIERAQVQLFQLHPSCPFFCLGSQSQKGLLPFVQRQSGQSRIWAEGTAADYNIISNVSFDQHHWAHPDERPGPCTPPRPQTKKSWF